MSAGPGVLDPRTAAVLRRALVSVCNQMGAALARAAYSPVISEGRDFAAGLFDRDGLLVACGDQDLTGLLGTLEPTIELVLERFPASELDDGDVLICNLPHEAGNHLNDIRLVKPIFAEGELVAFAATVGHWTDVGGSVPGSINPFAGDLYAEGLRIPPARIVRAGRFAEELAGLIVANVRLPQEATGDLWAQITALETGSARLGELIADHGVATVRAVFTFMQHHAETLLRRQLREIQDGEVACEEWMDPDPLEPERGPLCIRLTLTKREDRLIADFSASDAQPRAGIASTRSLTASGVYVALLNLFPGVAFNHGAVRCVDVVTTPGTTVHAAFPAPVSGSAACGFEKVLACMMRGIGALAPAKQVAAPYNLVNATLGGIDPRRDEQYVMYLWSEGGFGAGLGCDGGDEPSLTMYASGSRNQSVEVHERLFPLRYQAVELITDSGGAGTWRGGPGVRHSFEVTRGEGVLGVLGDRRAFPPWGVQGGHSSIAQGVWVNRGDPAEQDLGVAAARVPVRAGDRVEMISAGGGGYGDPRLRDPALVLRDVELGLVSAAAARDVYGVVLEPAGSMPGAWSIDTEATREERDRQAYQTGGDEGRP